MEIIMIPDDNTCMIIEALRMRITRVKDGECFIGALPTHSSK